MLLTERYGDRIEGVLFCYNRIVIPGNIPELCFAGGMTAYSQFLTTRIRPTGCTKKFVSMPNG